MKNRAILNALPPWIDPSDYSAWKREQKEQPYVDRSISAVLPFQHEEELSRHTIAHILEPVCSGEQLSLGLFPTIKHERFSCEILPGVDFDVTILGGEQHESNIIMITAKIGEEPVGFKDISILAGVALDIRWSYSEQGLEIDSLPHSHIRIENADRASYVHRDYQDKGIGTKLLESSLEYAKRFGAEQYHVIVSPDCVDLLWYLKFGPDVVEDGRLIYYTTAR